MSNKDMHVSNKKIFYIIASIMIPIIMVILRPMDLDLNQSIVFGSLLTVIIWWGSGIVNQTLACFVLLAVFVAFGRTPIRSVFYFPLSSDFILITCAFLLSQGVVNSKVADRISELILSKYCDSALKLVICSFVLAIVLVFVIPQPFPRVILLSSMYINFMKGQKISEESKEAVLFSIFVAATVTSLLLLNGDIIQNFSALKFGNINMSYLEWAKYMTLPSFVVLILTALVFIMVFKKEILNVNFTKAVTSVDQKMSKEEIISLAIILGVIVLWLTESIHHISVSTSALIGTLAMFATRIIGIKDLKALNVKLLIFLTAEFAIGKVMTGSGTAFKLSNYLTGFFPDPGSYLYLPFIVILIMALHMVMGSLITSLSVIITSLIPIVSGHLSPEVVVLLTSAAVSVHYLMPFHHVTIMIGFGNGCYQVKHTLKLGLRLTIMTIITTLFIYVPWWRLTGLF